MDLLSIKGIGESRKKSFEENDIFSCEDLINYFPTKYYDFTKTEPYADDGNVRLIKAIAVEVPKIVKIRTALSFVTCKMTDETGHVFNAVWYNQTYVKSQVYLGAELFLYGKNSPSKKNTFVVSLHKFVKNLEGVNFLPVYKNISGIGQKTLHDSINACLESLNLSTFIPNELLYKYNLIDLKEAYFLLHNPENLQDLDECKRRVDIEKLIPILAVNEYHKLQAHTVKKQQYKNISLLQEEFEALIPFSLTMDQKKAISDICLDFSSHISMNRLLQGDVGSGKTIVSLFGAFVAAKNGYQAAIVSPTEILANQHYETICKLFKTQNFNCVKLTGSTKGLEKQIISNQIESGKANIIVGTHAIFSDGIAFNNLSYIVIDEQHRFGVAQRAKLKEKGNTPDILVLSATPIPRSLALVVFGDLDISIINSRPKVNNTKTNIVIKSKQFDMWNYLKQKVEEGSKLYVVCANIDEENENESVNQFSAKNMFEKLALVFGKEQTALIHGKLSKETQSQVIENFRLGKIKVLISTTIVEVGMDIPNADLMVIASPEKFGLATLHQLRGRIGRNGEEAYCFCLADNLNEKSYNRISFFKNHTNGFEIADFDLKSRGSGNIMGTEQHGEAGGLFSMFSIEAFSTAGSILEQIKPNISLYTQILTIGEQVVNAKSFNKIVLN